jgi:hypothetical protein
MPTELADSKKLEFDEEVYDIGPGKCTGSCGSTTKRMEEHRRRFWRTSSRLSACQLWLCAGLQGDFDSPILRLSYTSLTTPSTTMDHNLATHNRQGS